MPSAGDFASELLRKSERRAASRLQAWAERKSELLLGMRDQELAALGVAPIPAVAREVLQASFAVLAVNLCLIDNLEQIFRRTCALPEALPQSQAHCLVDCWGRAQLVRALLVEMLASHAEGSLSQERLWALLVGAEDSLFMVVSQLARQGELARIAKLSDWARSLLSSQALQGLRSARLASLLAA
jgi:hypothetical protein